MSVTYTQFPHTNFPDAVDDDKKYGYLQDVPYSMKDKVLAYQKAFSEGNTVECERLLSENPTLAKCMWKAIDYNWMRDAVLAMENYYISDVTAAIDEARGHAIGLNDNIKPGQAGAASSGWSINKLGNTFVGGANALAIDGNTLTYKSYTGSDLGSVTIPNNNKSHAGFVPVPSGTTDDEMKYRFWSTNASGVPGWYKYDKLHDLVTKDTEKPLQFWSTGSDGNPLWRPMSSFNASASRSGFMSSGTYQSLFNKKADGTANVKATAVWATDKDGNPAWRRTWVNAQAKDNAHDGLTINTTLKSVAEKEVPAGSYFVMMTATVGLPANLGNIGVHQIKAAIHTSQQADELDIKCLSRVSFDGNAINALNTKYWISITACYSYTFTSDATIYGLLAHDIANTTLTDVYANFCVAKIV